MEVPSTVKETVLGEIDMTAAVQCEANVAECEGTSNIMSKDDNESMNELVEVVGESKEHQEGSNDTCVELERSEENDEEQSLVLSDGAKNIVVSDITLGSKYPDQCERYIEELKNWFYQQNIPKTLIQDKVSHKNVFISYFDNQVFGPPKPSDVTSVMNISNHDRVMLQDYAW